MSPSSRFGSRSRALAYALVCFVVLGLSAVGFGQLVEDLVVSGGGPLWVGRLASLGAAVIIGIAWSGPVVAGWIATEGWRHGS